MPVIRAYLQLVRFPAVFSAMADIFLGFLLVHSSLDVDGSPLPFLLLLAASSCLYLAGMAFNDIFDRKVDAAERPNRPIPSGRVPLRSAICLGTGLVAGGITAAGFVGGGSLIVACLLVAAIICYDGLLKQTFLGPPMMGACRTLNVLLGASAAGDLTALLDQPTIAIAASYGIYIAGLTWFARNEAVQSKRGRLIASAAVINIGLVALIAWAVLDNCGLGGRAPRSNVLFAAAVIAVVVNRGLWLAVSQPSPERVQRAVKTMLQWLIVLNATLVYAATGDAYYGILTASLMLPAVVLGYWLYVT